MPNDFPYQPVSYAYEPKTIPGYREAHTPALGSTNEQQTLEDLVVESIEVKGNDYIYLPRELVSKDSLFGEDRLSEFNKGISLKMYLESIDGYEGRGHFFGVEGPLIEQSASLILSRRKWFELAKGNVESDDEGNARRPFEGDWIVDRITNALFEVKFVEHQNPFYQLNKRYVYKLEIELAQYSSENINTGNEEADDFEDLKSFQDSLTKIVEDANGVEQTETINTTSNIGEDEVEDEFNNDPETSDNGMENILADDKNPIGRRR